MTDATHEPPPPAYRIGLGFDMHPFAPEESGRPLLLGGVTIPGHRGLVGHSDADVLLHSICDALLGALGMGDLGRHFPDDRPEYEGISSLVLLEKVVASVVDRGYHVVNVDAVVIAQVPRISPWVEAMRETIARVLRTHPAAVNIKATSPERMGGIGRGEGMAAETVALLGRE